MLLRELLVEGYREVEAKFVDAGADPQSVADAIAQYRDLVNRNQVKGNERNIDWWGKNHTFQDFQQFLQQKSIDTSKTQLKKSRDTGRSVNLLETDQWLVVVPLDKDASCFHGKNSDWCTTKREHGYYEDYFYNRNIILIYCLNKQTGGMWAIASYRHIDLPDPDDEDAEESEYDLSALEANGWAEYFDQKDNTLTQSQFNQQTGLDSEHLLNLSDKLMGRDQPVQQRLAQRNQQLRQTKDTLARGTKQRDVDLERELIDLGDDASAYDYVVRLGQAGVDAGTLPIKLQYLAARNSVRDSVLPWFKTPDPRVVDISIKNQSGSLAYAIDNDLLTPKALADLNVTRLNAELIQKLIDKKLFTPELRDRLAANTLGVYALHRAGQKVTQDEIERAIIGRDQYSHGIVVWDTVHAMQEFNFVPSDEFFERSAELMKVTPANFRKLVVDKINSKINDTLDTQHRAQDRLESNQVQIRTYQDKIADFRAELNDLTSLDRLSYQQQDRVKRIQAEINIYKSSLSDYAESNKQHQETIEKITKQLKQLRGFAKQLADNS